MRILIKGAGEHSSGTAHRLFRAGYQVVMTEIAAPTAVRRQVAFCQAVFDGSVEVEGVLGRRWELDAASALGDFDFSHVPVFVDAGGLLIGLWRPDVVVDGRILKRNLDNRLDQAPLVIGLGPGLEAGVDVHRVVETMRGHNLGRLIDSGLASPNTGTPGTIAGRNAERVLRAPRSGLLSARLDIGAQVEAGTLIATVDGAELRASIGGVIRGLVHDGLTVRAGQKLGDVDPRGDVAACATLSDKTRTLSGAVLEAVVAFERGRR